MILDGHGERSCLLPVRSAQTREAAAVVMHMWELDMERRLRSADLLG